MKPTTDVQLSSELDHLVSLKEIRGYAFDRYWKDTVWTISTNRETYTLESFALRLLLDSHSFGREPPI